MFVIGPDQMLDFAISAVLPALVALLARQSAHPGLKAVLLLLLNAVSGFLTTWLGAIEVYAPFLWQQAVWTSVTGFFVAVAAHFGLLGPIGLTGSAGLIQRKVPAGVGKRRVRHGQHEKSA